MHDDDAPYPDGGYTQPRLRIDGMDPRHALNIAGACVRDACPACWEQKVTLTADLAEAVEIELTRRKRARRKAKTPK